MDYWGTFVAASTAMPSTSARPRSLGPRKHYRNTYEYFRCIPEQSFQAVQALLKAASCAPVKTSNKVNHPWFPRHIDGLLLADSCLYQRPLPAKCCLRQLPTKASTEFHPNTHWRLAHGANRARSRRDKNLGTSISAISRAEKMRAAPARVLPSKVSPRSIAPANAAKMGSNR